MMKKAGRVRFLVLCGTALIGYKVLAADEGGSPVRFSVDSKVQYTDNRDSSEQNKESTFDIFLTPRVAVGIDKQQLLVDFHLAPSVRYRTDPSPFDNEWQWLVDAGADLQHSPTPTLKFRVKEQFDYTDDPSVDSQGLTVRDRSYYLNRFEAGANWQFRRWSALDAYGRYAMKSYTDSEVSNMADEDRGEFGVMLWRQVAATVGVKALGRYNTYALEEVNGVSRDFDTWLGALGAEKKLTPTFRGSASVGWMSAQYKDDRLGSDSGPFADLTLLGSLSPVLRISSALTHSIREADAHPYASQEFTEFSARAEWDSSAMVTLGLTGAIRQGSYDAENVGMTTAQLAGGDETSIVVVGDVAIKVTPKSTIRFSQKYEDLDSDVAESYTKNTSSLSYTAMF